MDSPTDRTEPPGRLVELDVPPEPGPLSVAVGGDGRAWQNRSPQHLGPRRSLWVTADSPYAPDAATAVPWPMLLHTQHPVRVVVDLPPVPACTGCEAPLCPDCTP